MGISAIHLGHNNHRCRRAKNSLWTLFARTLVFSPHIDDDVFIYGLLGRAIKQGCCVSIAVAGTGDHYQPHAGREVTVEERQTEMSNAGATFGITQFETGFPGFDGRLDMLPLSKVIGWMEDGIIRHRPTAVLLPVPSQHQDHRVVYEAGLTALRPGAAAGVKLAAAYEYPCSVVWPVPTSISNISHLVVPISKEQLEQKIAAFRRHQSQVNGRPNNHPLHPESIRKLAELRGMEIGVEYAELLYPLRIVF